MGVFALTIYRVLMFPTFENFVNQIPIRHLIGATREEKDNDMLLVWPLCLVGLSYRRKSGRDQMPS